MPCCPTWLELPAAGPTHSGRLGAPSSDFTIVAPVATARNNADAMNSVLDPRDTRIIANRAATVVNEVWVLTWEIIIWSSLRYFCPPCFTMTHECPRVCVRISPHNAPGNRFHSCSPHERSDMRGRHVRL